MHPSKKNLNNLLGVCFAISTHMFSWKIQQFDTRNATPNRKEGLTEELLTTMISSNPLRRPLFPAFLGWNP